MAYIINQTNRKRSMESKLDFLYRNAIDNVQNAEKELFKYLGARFKYLVQLEISDQHDGEEIVQDTLMAIAEKYRELEVEVSFAAWAFKVLKNKQLNYFRMRRYKRNRFAEMSDYNDMPFDSDPDLRIRIIDCLKRICKSYIRSGRILNLYYQGYSTEDICKKLSLTRNNAYSVLYRARSMLQTCLDMGDI